MKQIQTHVHAVTVSKVSDEFTYLVVLLGEEWMVTHRFVQEEVDVTNHKQSVRLT